MGGTQRSHRVCRGDRRILPVSARDEHAVAVGRYHPRPAPFDPPRGEHGEPRIVVAAGPLRLTAKRRRQSWSERRGRLHEQRLTAAPASNGAQQHARLTGCLADGTVRRSSAVPMASNGSKVRSCVRHVTGTVGASVARICVSAAHGCHTGGDAGTRPVITGVGDPRCNEQQRCQSGAQAVETRVALETLEGRSCSPPPRRLSRISARLDWPPPSSANTRPSDQRSQVRPNIFY